MFALYLNDMRAAQVENLTCVARADTAEALQALLDREQEMGPWVDGPWHKVFRRGGPLEWYNPSRFGPEHVKSREEIIAAAGAQWDEWAATIPTAESL